MDGSKKLRFEFVCDLNLGLDRIRNMIEEAGLITMRIYVLLD